MKKAVDKQKTKKVVLKNVFVHEEVRAKYTANYQKNNHILHGKIQVLVIVSWVFRAFISNIQL